AWTRSSSPPTSRRSRTWRSGSTRTSATTRTREKRPARPPDRRRRLGRRAVLEPLSGPGAARPAAGPDAARMVWLAGRRARACSSVVEHRTFNPRVVGSIPTGPTLVGAQFVVAGLAPKWAMTATLTATRLYVVQGER